MGITATLYALTSEEFDNLPTDDFEIIEVLIPVDIHSNPRFFDLQKEWSIIHYLLCGAVEPDGSVLGDAVLGGVETHIEMDFGRARYRAPEQVAEISAALALVDLRELFEKADTSSSAFKDVYLGEVFLEEGVESIKPMFASLLQFYAKTASEEKAILSYLS